MSHIAIHTNEGTELVELTSEEETLLTTEREKAATESEAHIARREAKGENKSSGIKKLKDLGLTDDEISALVG